MYERQPNIEYIENKKQEKQVSDEENGQQEKQATAEEHRELRRETESLPQDVHDKKERQGRPLRNKKLSVKFSDYVVEFS